jgi:hypothetical protein
MVVGLGPLQSDNGGSDIRLSPISFFMDTEYPPMAVSTLNFG